MTYELLYIHVYTHEIKNKKKRRKIQFYTEKHLREISLYQKLSVNNVL